MAIKMTNHDWCDCLQDYRTDFICDTEADVASLPASCAQSTALVAETGNVYIVNASGNWVKFGG